MVDDSWRIGSFQTRLEIGPGIAVPLPAHITEPEIKWKEYQEMLTTSHDAETCSLEYFRTTETSN